jgi:glycolate oxidase FAD binding subunit
MPADVAGPAAGPQFDCPTLQGAACAAYAVQGITPVLVLLPPTEPAAAAALAVCNTHGLAVAPWGGGALQAVGNTPTRLDVVLSLERLDQVVSYEPGDLTISVQSGVTLTKLLDTLGAHGQMLPFDVPASPRATVGGAIATNLAGPRRFGPGSFRDLLIGLTVAAPDGTISKAGGMVVKNVSGYDMMKLHLGALGTLGLLLRLNFKVLTQPAFDGTAVIAGDRGRLLELGAALANSQLALDSLELFGPGAPSAEESDWRLAARLTGSEQGVARKRGDLTALCTAAGLTPVWTQGQAMLAAWQRCADFLAPATVADDEALLRLSAPPAQLGPTIDRIETATRESQLHLRLAAHAGNGVVFARLRGPRLATLLPPLLATLGTGGSAVVLLTAPPDVKRSLDVWGPLPDSFPLMQRIKAEFDPRNTLNPGRFLGRL